MKNINRRKFITLTGGAMAAAGTLLTIPGVASAGGKRVVVVGGGPGGATAARYLRLLDSSIEVTLIEAKANYHTCFMSNEVLGGMRSLDSIMVTFDGLRKLGVNVVTDMVTAVDADKHVVKTAGGDSFGYDRLILSPGIDFKFGAVDGYSAETANTIPHAWKAGSQTALLRKQLVALEDGANVVIVAPPNPFRCPPGPYERASLIAHYLKYNKPKSKVLVVDTKDKFSKQGLFTAAWKRFYGFGTDKSIIEWMPASEVGGVVAINAKNMTVETEFETFKGGAINYIPPQNAGKIASVAGIADDSGWCPINKKTFESTLKPNIHVLGDAAIATKMPKSGYAANVQAKVAAAAVVDLFNGREPGTPSFVNTCYSVAAKDHAFSVSAVYRFNEAENLIAPVKGAGGLSPMDASDEYRKREVDFAHGWYNNIRIDSWG